MTFTELNLCNAITTALTQKGYTTPTPIQGNAIPHILAQRDIFGCAQTGTGKTAAFALPILHMLDKSTTNNSTKGIKALILAPTRELALQISENISLYGSNLTLKHAVIFGGVSQQPQVAAIKNGIDILIATPGRLLDLMQQGIIKLNNIQFLVLDEADRMLDMGFINDIKKIIAKIPAQRQTIFFSATASDDIMKLAQTLLQNPVHVQVAPVSSTAVSIGQTVYYVKKENKKELLKHLLLTDDIEHALIFTRTKHGADKVVKDLKRSGISAMAIHGNKSQNERVKALKNFKEKSVRMLVATDVASRGIDVEKLSHVINFDLPEQAEAYVHRIGRTGRAGESGTAVSFCAEEEFSYLKDINKLIKKNIEVVQGHPFSFVASSSTLVQKSTVATAPKRTNRKRRPRRQFQKTV